MAMPPIDLLKQGYAEYFQVAPDIFTTPGLRIIETIVRDQPVWDRVRMPVWMVSIPPASLCCVAPRYAKDVRSVLRACAGRSLCDPQLLRQCQQTLGQVGWHAHEILYYPHVHPPVAKASCTIQQFNAAASIGAFSGAQSFLQDFASGVYIVQNDVLSIHTALRILAWVGVKDNHLIQELAVNTQPEHRRKGFAQALVARAVADILTRKQVPVYVPDALDNLPSYALAKSLGFEKAGEMLYWEVEI
jgi:hypothetical protein